MRIFMAVTIGCAVITIALSFFSYDRSVKEKERAASELAAMMAKALDARLDLERRPMISIAERAAQFDGFASQWVLYEGSIESGRLYDHLGLILLTHSSINSMGIILDPSAWGRSTSEVTHAPFVVQDSAGFDRYDRSDALTKETIDGILERSKELKTPFWLASTPPDGTSDQIVLTMNCPIEKGVVVFTLSNEWIDESLKFLSLPHDGGFRLVDDEGREIFRTPMFADDDSVIRADAKLASSGLNLAAVFPRTSMIAVAKESSLLMLVMGAGIAVVTVIIATWLATFFGGSVKLLTKRIESSANDLDNEIAITDGMEGDKDISALAKSIDATRKNFAILCAEHEHEVAVAERDRADSLFSSEVNKHFFTSTKLVGSKFVSVARVGDNCLRNGEFYDLYQSDRGSVVAIVGRVDGDGPERVILASSAMSYLRSMRLNCNEPNTALANLNSLLAAHWGEFKLSAMIAEFYPPTGTCVLSDAGYPALTLIRGGAPVEVVFPKTESLTGVEVELARTILNMSKGDSILLCGDRAREASVNGQQLPIVTALALQSQQSALDAAASLQLTDDSIVILLQYIG